MAGYPWNKGGIKEGGMRSFSRGMLQTRACGIRDSRNFFTKGIQVEEILKEVGYVMHIYVWQALRIREIMLKQRRMCCLGHAVRMDDGRIPKDLLYGEFVQGKHPTGRPQLRYKDVCKRDLMRAMSINLTEHLGTSLKALRLTGLATDGTEGPLQVRRDTTDNRPKRRE